MLGDRQENRCKYQDRRRDIHKGTDDQQNDIDNKQNDPFVIRNAGLTEYH